MRVRPWLIGAVVYAGGIVGWVVFKLWKPPGSRAEAGDQAMRLALIFGVGLVLLSVPVVRLAYTPGEPSRKELVGCLLLALAVLVAFGLVISTLGS